MQTATVFTVTRFTGHDQRCERAMIEAREPGYSVDVMTTLHTGVEPRREATAGEAATLALALRQPAPARVVWLDVLRIVAILAVITIHTVSPLTAGATVSTFSGTWWLAATMNVASLWCVPVFVMISGGLLLRPAKSSPAATFYRRRLNRIGVPLVFWTVVYLALRPTLFGEHLTRTEATRDLATGHPYLQLYYLYVIAGLYAVTPLLRQVIARASTDRLRLFAIGVLAFNIADYTLAVVLGAGGVNALTEWMPFVGYFLAGAWLMATPVKERTAAVAALVAVAAAVATLVLSATFIDVFGWTSTGRYFLGYQSPTVVVMSIALFLAVRARATQRAWKQQRLLARVGEVTFGVFLLHPLVLVPLLQHAGRPSHLATVSLGVPAIVVIVAVASAAATVVLNRVPYVRRVVS
jgi:surface polysaccharide O-acyltransferase-like enzyme